MGVADSSGDLGPPTRLANSSGGKRAAGDEVVVDRVEPERRKRAPPRQFGCGEEGCCARWIGAREEREQGAFVLSMAAAQFGKHGGGQGVQRIA